MARFTTKISLRGAIRGRTCARSATACPRNWRRCIAHKMRYARARVFPRRSRPAGARAGAFPRFQSDGKRKEHARVDFPSRVPRRSSGVFHDAARPSIPARRATCAFATRTPHGSPPSSTRALTAPFSPLVTPRVATEKRVEPVRHRVFASTLASQKKRPLVISRTIRDPRSFASHPPIERRRTSASRATASCTPRIASRARMSARP